MVKSQKKGGICLACLDESNDWIRPIKLGVFQEKDIVMDNRKVMDIFDVVEMNFEVVYPIKHHKENMKIVENDSIKFIRNLSDSEKKTLLLEISESNLLNNVETKLELYDEIIKLNRSLVLLGPITSFDISYNLNHPRIWFKGKNDEEFYVSCTDLKFCAFNKSKINDFMQKSADYINSKDVEELKDKETYFVIGLTGDHLNKDGEIESGKFASRYRIYEARYWPMVVGIITVPDYFQAE